MNFFSNKDKNKVTSRNESKQSKNQKNEMEIDKTNAMKVISNSDATLGTGNLRLAVLLPDNEDINEWIAVHTVDLFMQVNMLYGTITEFCTDEMCPIMNAGTKFEYQWADGNTIKKPIKCSAPQYIDYLMTWIQQQLDNEEIFPCRIGTPFKKNFLVTVKRILKRLFRVYAHVYLQHFDKIKLLEEDAHLNTSFKHFIYFVGEFQLIEKKEMEPMQMIIDALLKHDKNLYI
ncbi:hypothetical protein SNEBB_010343 [Seison nebaliae]|nr:hypothetical protein SNEBB_010343 [Seison nebaliae]